MIISPEIAFLVGSLLVYVSILAGRTGYKIGVPVLLFFLLVGMLFGQDGIGLQFDSAEHAQSLGMVAMSIILFAGGMDTQFKDIRTVLKPGIVLSTVGVLLTALFTGLFIWGLSGFFVVWYSFLFLGCLVAGSHDVFYRCSLCLCYIEFSAFAFEAKPAPYAGIGKWQ